MPIIIRLHRSERCRFILPSVADPTVVAKTWRRRWWIHWQCVECHTADRSCGHRYARSVQQAAAKAASERPPDPAGALPEHVFVTFEQQLLDQQQLLARNWLRRLQIQVTPGGHPARARQTGDPPAGMR